MIVAGLDLETTGISQEEGHRIIELGISVYHTADGRDFKKIGKTWLQRVNPMRSIDPGAELVHGISLKDLKNEPEWEEVAERVHKILTPLDLLVCHNANFDAPFIALELARVGYKIPDFEVFCTMENGRSATALGSVPNLGQLCWAFDVAYDGDSAHAADYDIDVTMECFFRGLKRGTFEVPLIQKFAEKRSAA